MRSFKIADHQNLTYYIYTFLTVYFIAVTYILIASHQVTGWDPGLCIKMADNSYKKIPFNYYEHPSPANLNKDETEFVAWWSPGQFALPLLIKSITGSKIGSAVKILTFLCMSISAFGIYRLFNHLIIGSSSATYNKLSQRLITFIALIFILMQPFFWGNIHVYDGGGILMLCYCPWFIYWVVKIKGINFYKLFILLIGALAGFFLKTSFTSILLGALFYLFLSTSITPAKSLKDQNFKLIIKNGIILAAVFLTYILIIKISFLSHNKNIADSATTIRIQPRVILYPIVAPVLGVFSFNFLNRTIQWAILSVLIIPYYYFLLRSNNITSYYKQILTGFLGACIVFFALLYIINVDVSYELRHYVVISILITPVFFIVFHKLTRVQYVLYSFFAIVLCFNTFLFVKQASAVIKDEVPVVTYTGFKSLYPNKIIEKIHSLDSVKNRSIFYFQSDDPSIALELRNNRVLFEDNYVNFHFDNAIRKRKTLYYGYNSGDIYVIYKDSQIKTDSAKYLTRFERYKNFKDIYKSDGYTIFRAVRSN